MKQVTKWKSLDPDTVRKFLKANPEFIDKHRGKVAKDKPERIELLGVLRAGEINSMCFKGGQMDKAPVLAHNSPNLIAFCEAVRNYLETVDCAEHISKDGQPVMCGLIDEGCHKNDTDCQRAWQECSHSLWSSAINPTSTRNFGKLYTMFTKGTLSDGMSVT